jgi:hypothetical protein
MLLPQFSCLRTTTEQPEDRNVSVVHQLSRLDAAEGFSSLTVRNRIQMSGFPMWTFSMGGRYRCSFQVNLWWTTQ